MSAVLPLSVIVGGAFLASAAVAWVGSRLAGSRAALASTGHWAVRARAWWPLRIVTIRLAMLCPVALAAATLVALRAHDGVTLWLYALLVAAAAYAGVVCVTAPLMRRMTAAQASWRTYWNGRIVQALLIWFGWFAMVGACATMAPRWGTHAMILR